ncbi:hypothetical protein QO004_005135 [Rhizobium mesoamericanum]|nr:hypothetical protein [Rhizobium mesoamericanum]
MAPGYRLVPNLALPCLPHWSGTACPNAKAAILLPATAKIEIACRVRRCSCLAVALLFAVAI